MRPAGALKRMLEEKANQPPSPAPGSIPPVLEQPAANNTSRQIYPLKGHATVPPECCKPWKYADRGDFEFDHVGQLAESFGKEGQLQPVIVRPAADPSDPLIRYEIIAGRARWLSAKKAGTKLEVMIRQELKDEEAFRVMVQENESRRNLSDYSRGRRFKHALESGLYTSQGELAKAFKLSDPTVTRLLATASLDARIVAAFSTPAAIGSALGLALKRAEESGLIGSIIRDAKRIEAGEIRLADIPGVWAGDAKEPTKAEAPTERSETDTPKRASSPARRVVGAGGKTLFLVKTAPDRLPTVRFKVAVDDAFFDELKVLLEKRLKRKRG